MTNIPLELSPLITDLALRIFRERLDHRLVLAFDQPDPVKRLVAGFLPLVDDKVRETLRGTAVVFCNNEIKVTDTELAMALICNELVAAENKFCSNNYIQKTFPSSVLLSKFPELQKQMDDDGLLPASVFVSKRKLVDALIYKNHAIYLSEAIPRMLGSKLIEIANAGATSGLKIQVSHYFVVPLEQYLEPLEKALDRGPSFSEMHVTDRLREVNATSVLTRRSPPEDKGLYWRCHFHEYERMEINRSQKMESGKTHVSFFAELLNPLPAAGADFIDNLIFHSDLYLNEASVVFKHADASMLVYEYLAYERRLTKKPPDTEKAQGHFKLFWMPGCPLALWKDLFHRTFPNTEFVGEYFTGDTFDPRKALGLPADYKPVSHF